jgi:hypothetical protein
MVAPLAPKDDGAGAPEDEIEITPQMIEAGALSLADLCEASLASQAKEVFRAMWAARKTSGSR